MDSDFSNFGNMKVSKVKIRSKPILTLQLTIELKEKSIDVCYSGIPFIPSVKMLYSK